MQRLNVSNFILFSTCRIDINEHMFINMAYQSNLNIPPPRGRGTALNPRNRFEKEEIILDPEAAASTQSVPTRYYVDRSVSVVSQNNSPDIGFDKSINPYRGCEHGCIYCYARPTHEYLGYSAGLDFETRIMVKRDAPQLLEKALSSSKWRPEVLAMSGVTDPYQPIERKLRLTRGCLTVLERFRNPVMIITKNSLIARDRDILRSLTSSQAVAVSISVTTLNPDLSRSMEPRTASPQKRLETIAQLASDGVPTGVMIAPVIPGLNDEEIPAILKAARESGASHTGFTALRLPLGVRELFIEWLNREHPNKKDRILDHIQRIRGGKLNDSRFGVRMRGEGVWAENLSDLFRAGLKAAGLGSEKPKISISNFRRPNERQLDFSKRLTRNEP